MKIKSVIGRSVMCLVVVVDFPQRLVSSSSGLQCSGKHFGAAAGETCLPALLPEPTTGDDIAPLFEPSRANERLLIDSACFCTFRLAYQHLNNHVIECLVGSTVCFVDSYSSGFAVIA